VCGQLTKPVLFIEAALGAKTKVTEESIATPESKTVKTFGDSLDESKKSGEKTSTGRTQKSNPSNDSIPSLESISCSTVSPSSIKVMASCTVTLDKMPNTKACRLLQHDLLSHKNVVHGVTKRGRGRPKSGIHQFEVPNSTINILTN